MNEEKKNEAIQEIINMLNNKVDFDKKLFNLGNGYVSTIGDEDCNYFRNLYDVVEKFKRTGEYNTKPSLNEFRKMKNPDYLYIYMNDGKLIFDFVVTEKTVDLMKGMRNWLEGAAIDLAATSEIEYDEDDDYSDQPDVEYNVEVDFWESDSYRFEGSDLVEANNWNTYSIAFM